MEGLERRLRVAMLPPARWKRGRATRCEPAGRALWCAGFQDAYTIFAELVPHRTRSRHRSLYAASGGVIWEPAAVSVVVTCAQCRQEGLEDDLIRDEEECTLRDHLWPSTPTRGAPGYAVRVLLSEPGRERAVPSFAPAAHVHVDTVLVARTRDRDPQHDCMRCPMAQRRCTRWPEMREGPF